MSILPSLLELDKYFQPKDPTVYIKPIEHKDPIPAIVLYDVVGYSFGGAIRTLRKGDRVRITTTAACGYAVRCNYFVNEVIVPWDSLRSVTEGDKEGAK